MSQLKELFESVNVAEEKTQKPSRALYFKPYGCHG